MAGLCRAIVVRRKLHWTVPTSAPYFVGPPNQQFSPHHRGSSLAAGTETAVNDGSLRSYGAQPVTHTDVDPVRNSPLRTRVEGRSEHRSAPSDSLDRDPLRVTLHSFAPLFRDLRSAKAIKALEQTRRFASHSDVPILIEGETGTGKTLLARYMHAISPRSDGPFEHVDIGTLDDTLASSELFGHIAGAFTDARRNRAGCFVSAKDGTIFLDEIGKASLAVQQKLLHAVEYGEVRPLGADRKVRVNARVVTASNRPLASLVEENRFLPDLHARLEAFRVYFRRCARGVRIYRYW